jgi:Na+/H+-dicarboxylate symporter
VATHKVSSLSIEGLAETAPRSLLGVALGYPFAARQPVGDPPRSPGWRKRPSHRPLRARSTLFFSLVVAVYELRQDDRMWDVVLKTLAIILSSAFFLVIVGLIVAVLFPPARIPILIEGQKEGIGLEVGQSILDLFPSNAFSAFAGDGSFILPLCVLAFFLGAGLSYDRTYSKVVTSLVDSLSRIFFYVAAFFSEILGVVMIALGAYWAVRLHGALKAEVFRDLIVLPASRRSCLAWVSYRSSCTCSGPKTNP